LPRPPQTLGCDQLSEIEVVRTSPPENDSECGVGSGVHFYGETLGLEFLWEKPVSVRIRCGDSSGLGAARFVVTEPRFRLRRKRTLYVATYVFHDSANR